MQQTPLNHSKAQASGPGLLLALFILVPLVILAALKWGPDPVLAEASRVLVSRESGYAGARSCRACHADHQASWARTYHSRMTQRPEGDAVLGAFDGRTVSYAGREVQLTSSEAGYAFQFPERRAEVALVVGSRRYQQYFEKVERGVGSVYLRLPFLWQVEEARWLHVNTVFMHPDDPNWNAHRSTWNGNCLFCHNTGVRPGLLTESGPQAFDSAAADLGIACEACHGPGATHVQAMGSPLRRYGLQAVPQAAQMLDPEDLGQAERSAICGQCHGQRLPEPLERLEGWLRQGPSFRPGDALEQHAAPIECETLSLNASQPNMFRDRFWGDGTPRLTAYEYQGMLQSACYGGGELSCITCHSMHAGDPKGMLTENERQGAACSACHTAIAADVGSHTGHDPAGPGSNCLACHMPPVVYGVLSLHRSHRIDSPDPARDFGSGRPHACTLCHLDKSPIWSAREMSRIWGKAYALPAQRPEGMALDAPDGLVSLLAGDAVQRAVFAAAMGRASGALDPRAKAFLRLGLALTLGDGYPSIRWTARKSLLVLETERSFGLAPRLEALDTTQSQGREAVTRALVNALASGAPADEFAPGPGLLLDTAFAPDWPAIVGLLERQSSHVISIGE